MPSLNTAISTVQCGHIPMFITEQLNLQMSALPRKNRRNAFGNRNIYTEALRIQRTKAESKAQTRQENKGNKNVRISSHLRCNFHNEYRRARDFSLNLLEQCLHLIIIMYLQIHAVEKQNLTLCFLNSVPFSFPQVQLKNKTNLPYSFATASP